MNKHLVIVMLLSAITLNAWANDNSDTTDIERKQPAHWSHLPIWGDKARELGYQLPIPVGLNIYYNKQSVAYDAKDNFNLGLRGSGWLNNLNANVVIPADDVIITGEDESIQLRADAWVLPFLNIYGLAGYTKGHKDILADLSNAEGLGNSGIDMVLPIPIEYTAYNLGLGAVLAGQAEVIPGMHPFIFTGVAAFTNSWTTTTDSTIQTYIGSIRMGQRYDVGGDKLAFLVGYNYQMINQKIGGSYDFNIPLLGRPGGIAIDYDVHLVSSESHNMSVSMVYDFGPKDEWNVFIEYGFLNWDQLLLSVGRRF
ncbi:hypothetical protein L2719_20695 [Shewanella schlegeliana]|uniref:Transporter n=1 Tax=Shewanella schlegeliana TaxID=190308 RepID=A0ABS1T6G3_9GAMM|nr:hypothetical protein [Shewanella schlegeliana]MBL4915407.1 hypothetical protein [Shewanella schlegeliana]MCL1111945.1 hypothetical protein [Shewanella schlegeliana]GIU24970.1 hypothetical protein TUM4433_09180 [Shewanella schlegeliana]